MNIEGNEYTLVYDCEIVRSCRTVTDRCGYESLENRCVRRSSGVARLYRI